MSSTAGGAAIKHTVSSLSKQRPARRTPSPTKSRISMAVSTRELDPAFQGAGQKAGIEIWRMENFRPVPVPNSSHGKFFAGDAYIVLKTTPQKNGSLRYAIHYWLGKDATQDVAGAAGTKTIELDAALGGRCVQYREVQGSESDIFLSYFKPCIIPQQGGASPQIKHEHVTRLFVCKGKHAVHVKEVPFARSSLSHDDIFILDTSFKIFQFNGSNTKIQERAKALDVVQYIRNTYHEGNCKVAAVEDGKLMADADAGEFWGLFGGFAPLPRKPMLEENGKEMSYPANLICIYRGQRMPITAEPLTRDLLDTYKCYIMDCGLEIFVWIGRESSLEERKSACSIAEEFLQEPTRTKSTVVRFVEGFETVAYRAKFSKWSQATELVVSEEKRSKVTAILRRQGLNVKGAMKSTPVIEELQPYIDCTGKLQVWRVNGEEKTLLTSSEHTKLYTGECYVFQYAYPGDDTDEFLIGTWFGKRSVEEERTQAISHANKMIESLKFQAALACIYEGKEPVQFFSILQSCVVYKGGESSGFKAYLENNSLSDDTYSEKGIALFRVQGLGRENMQSIQVDPVASSLNSSYCFILHNGDTIYTWIGSLSTSIDQELVDRQLDAIKPNLQSRLLKEGSETDHFWRLLGGKAEYPGEKIGREQESDPRLFSYTSSNGKPKVTEIFSFSQDDLMTEDVYILHCHSHIFIWVGQQVDVKIRTQALTIGEKFLELDILMEKLSRETPIFVVMEGSEPKFFTRFFSWNPAKAAMHGNSFQRKLSIVKDGITPTLDKVRRRAPTSQAGRSSVPDKSQRARSISFSPDRVRVRGRSPAFNALAANFENPTARNLSTPPPAVNKVVTPKSASLSPGRIPPKSASIAAISASFERAPKLNLMPKSVKTSPNTTDTKQAANASKTSPVGNKAEPLANKDDVKESEPADAEGLLIYPYERVITSSADPATDIDVTKRESYLSSKQFRDKFGMTRDAFYKLPKWKQNRLKLALHLF